MQGNDSKGVFSRLIGKTGSREGGGVSRYSITEMREIESSQDSNAWE